MTPAAPAARLTPSETWVLARVAEAPWLLQALQAARSLAQQRWAARWPRLQVLAG